MSIDLRWSLATPFGIAINEEKDAWHTGHINDMVRLDNGTGGMLIASSTGGVWLLDVNNDAFPLSDRWNKPDINCLAAGPDGLRHFFAGVSGSGGNGNPDGPGSTFTSAIYEADPESAAPLLNWNEIATFPVDAGNVNDIAVIRPHRRIIAACDNGLYWAEIPVPNPPAGCLSCIFPMPKPARDPFVWHKVVDPGFGQGGYFSVNIGSLTGRTERAGEEPLVGISVIVGSLSGGAMLGTWTTGDLKLRRAKLFDAQGGEWTDWYWLPAATGATSVAVCDHFPTIAYLVTAYFDGQLKIVARSTDGGRSWVMCSKELRPPNADADLTIAAGDQGNKWNNCICVTPTAPAVVALGWRWGTFVSADAGGSWKNIGDSPHLHSDVHMVQITPRVDEDAHDLWIASDGGLARVDLDTWLATGDINAQSNYNRQLPIIQCYATYVMRQFWGTLSGSTVFPSDGFVATGVQDNGNLYADLSAGPAPWREIDQNDGGWVAFLEDGGLLHRYKDSSVSSALRDLSGPFLIDKGVIPLQPPIPGAPPGLSSSTFGDVIRHPTFRGPSGQHMVAVGASASSVYGLYLEPGSATGYHWELIASLPAGLTSSCVASFSGHTVFAASGARIFVIDSKSGFTLELPVKLPQLSPSKPQTGGGVVRIVCVDKDKTFAVMNDTSEGNHYVIRLDGLVWGVPGVVTPVNSPIFGFDAARNFQGKTYLFATTGSRVWASEDESRTWIDISRALPERPHNAEIRLVTKGRDSWLYLSTHGRSVWRAPLLGFF